jgi:hypothetical protein
VRLSPLGNAATTGLLYQPQMMMVIVEKLVEWRLAGETEVLGENLHQRQFATPWPDPGSNPGRRGGKPATLNVTLHYLFETNPEIIHTIHVGLESYLSFWHVASII